MFKIVRGAIILMPFLLCSFLSLSQGGRSSGLANANVCLKDEASVFNNISGSAEIKSLSGVVFYNNRFGVSSFNTVSAAVLIPTKWGVATADISRYGNSTYNESYAGVGFTHKIQNVSLGVKASYAQLHIEEYGTKGTIVLELGGIAEIIPGITFGAHIYNLNQASYSKEAKEKVPVLMKAGLGFKPFEKLLLLTQVEKDVNYKTNFKAGIEYKIIKSIFLRTGIGSYPVHNSFGFGLDLKRFKIDYALSSYQNIGFQHSFSLIGKFKGSERK